MATKSFFERNLTDYSMNYLGPFEEIQVKFRRIKVLEILDYYSPKIILEVGCGKDSIVNYMTNGSFEKFIIIEPIASFLEVAVNKKSNKILSINKTIEQIHELNIEPDFVIISGLLHEVIDPLKTLNTLHGIITDNTIVHINVPNAGSFHRLLAEEMGIIDSKYEISPRQIELQQSRTFDLDSLTKLIKLAGFEVIERGSYFVKPFTHLQMQQMLDKAIITHDIIKGLNSMIKYMPELGSEIFLNVHKKKSN